MTPVESNSEESKFRLSRINVVVPRCRKPYYLHSLSQIYLSKHVYYLGIKIGSQVKHPVIDFDIFTNGRTNGRTGVNYYASDSSSRGHKNYNNIRGVAISKLCICQGYAKLKTKTLQHVPTFKDFSLTN